MIHRGCRILTDEYFIWLTDEQLAAWNYLFFFVFSASLGLRDLRGAGAGWTARLLGSGRALRVAECGRRSAGEAERHHCLDRVREAAGQGASALGRFEGRASAISFHLDVQDPGAAGALQSLRARPSSPSRTECRSCGFSGSVFQTRFRTQDDLAVPRKPGACRRHRGRCDPRCVEGQARQAGAEGSPCALDGEVFAAKRIRIADGSTAHPRQGPAAYARRRGLAGW